MWTHEQLDAIYPTLVRYTGLVLIVVLIVASIAGFYVQAAPGFVAATGMVLFKTVRDAARTNNGPNGAKAQEANGA